MAGTADVQAAGDLIADMGRFALDPLGHVRYSYTWGRGELAEAKGPRDWQEHELGAIGDALRRGHREGLTAIQRAIASGHGPGKSTLVAWLGRWAVDTCVDARGVVTANTDTQLRTKTWPEFAKWHRLSMTQAWFKLEATSLHSALPGHEKTWRLDIVPWSERNTEAFAGLHNKGRRIIVLFDEASGIADPIWSVTEGALTDADTEILWFVYGNPTQPIGRFRDCFGRLRHRWATRQIDSRTVEGTNLAQLNQWVDDYGEDSDFVRVRVRGEFPLQSETQLIPQDVVAHARKREVVPLRDDVLVAGFDIGRGTAESVMAFRLGRDARSIPWRVWNLRDSEVLAERAARALHEMRERRLNVHSVFVDGGGVGGPVADRLRHWGFPVIEVNFGAKAADPEDYLNKGSEMWGLMGDWLKGAAIPDDPILEEQLVTREFRFMPKSGQIALIPKDAMAAAGIPSPDRADALALTFAQRIVPKPLAAALQNTAGKSRTGYQPLEL